MVDITQYPKRPEQPRRLEVEALGTKSSPEVDNRTGEELAGGARTEVAKAISEQVAQIEAGEAPAVDPNILKGAKQEAQDPNAHVDNLQRFLSALNSGEAFDPAELTDNVLSPERDKAGLN